MLRTLSRRAPSLALALLAVFLAAFLRPPAAFAQTTVTTTVNISVCGDAQVTGSETCDDGANTGIYATTTLGRNCMPDCSGYAPWCGDSVLAARFGEECDDGNNNSNDRCSSVCKIENLPSGGGGGGSPGNFPGGGFTPPRETRIIIQGKAYPNATVHILKDGDTLGEVEADPKADFYFTSTRVSPGVATFGLWAEDNIGLKSVALTTTLTLISGAVTTISGAFVPPTISLDKRKVNRGEPVIISGQTAPGVTVVTHVNSSHEFLTTTSTDSRGRWDVKFDTSPLENEDFHTAKAHFETKVGDNVVKSILSQSISFYVGSQAGNSCGTSDLNSDQKVNLVDFSVLLFYWNTAGPIGDLNCDKKVNLIDFSILLFNWTG
jgi:cysteine-rich repeat protein